MYQIPPLELLESTHVFPTTYVFKVIGKSDRGFLARVVAVIREELKMEADPPYSSRDAVGGRHVAVTVEPTVATAAEVIAIYARLAKVEGVVMMM